MMTSRYQHNLESHYEASASSKPISLKLIFSNQVASPVFTTQPITGKTGGHDDDGNNSIKVILVDSNTEETITSGPLASAKVKIVLIRGDYHRGSTTKDFEKNIVDNWEKKKNVLLGDHYVHLERGCGTVGEIRIKQDKNHIKKVKFRLGAMVVDCPFTCVVEEAVTDQFEVKDKHILPKRLRQLSPEDKVGQLKNISCKRTSKIAMRLKRENIATVKEFLDMHFSDPQKLQEICNIKGKKWVETVNHAKTSLHGNVSIKSTSQLSNTLTSDDYLQFENKHCYHPQTCEDGHLSIQMKTDPYFSTEDLDQISCEPYFCTNDHVLEPAGQANQEWSVGNSVEWNGDKAKKRWMKVVCIFSLFKLTLKSS